MKQGQIGTLIFEKYSFTELDKRQKKLGIISDGTTWHGFLRDIQEQGGVLEAIGVMLRRAGQKNSLSNQFALLECWYNVARLYPVDGGLDRSESCSPDTFVAKFSTVGR